MALDLTTNSGMQLLADFGHVMAGGFLGVSWPINLFGPHAWHYSVALAVPFVLGKEFWYDKKYETAATSGGNKGGVRDMVGWYLGIAAVLVSLAIKGTLS